MLQTLPDSLIYFFLKEKLCSLLKDVLKSKPNVDVVKLQKSGGVVSRNPKVRQKARGNRIRVMIPLFDVTEIYLYYIGKKMC